MGKSLRAKLTIGALGLVILVCVAITAVVSYIVNRQNLQSVQRDLEKATLITETELSAKQRSLADEVGRMVEENTMGATVKFLYDYKDNDISITESTYYKIAGIVMSKTMAMDFRQVGIYDITGGLQAFALRKDKDIYSFGFYKSPQAHMNISKKGEQFDEGTWEHTERLESLRIDLKLPAAIPDTEKIYFGNRDGALCIETLTPVFANEFNDNGDPVLKQFGVVHAIKEIDSAFVDRLHLLTGMSINVFSGSSLSLGQLSDFATIDSSTAKNTMDKDSSARKTDIREITLNSGNYFLTAVPAPGDGTPGGSVALLQSDSIMKSNTGQMIKILSLVSLICLILMMPLVILFSRSIVKPILHIVSSMKDIAEGEGDLRERIPVTTRDEVGQLAQNFNTFVEKIQMTVRQIKDNLGLLNESSQSLSDISTSLASGAGQSSQKAHTVAAAGEEMSANMNSIAAAMEQAATNVSMVSTNAQQMSATIIEVIDNTHNARDITDKAVSQARKASTQVEELGVAASEIEKVIETITEISEQVNLLALNATIEAARAGEAGKGFAVVANEIKELAHQTASATNEIKKKVSDIRASTDGTVSEIEAITTVNSQINEIVLLISRKVEEQSVATSDIAENVTQASQGIGEVNENVAQSSMVAAEIARDIVEVTRTAEEISTSSVQVKERSTSLSELSEKLKRIVDSFKV